ncbi:MAG TPA: DNA polymerase III subunit gamma/tau [Tepidisphaeraceae bacterium]|nr:DNA polymerase III subunit gamma/tau [Tepidisphaeraceae bacterium]
MSYTVLARRYRSTTFDEIVGQEQIAQTLKKAIETGRIAHAYLFCGTRGTGKTSTARILAKCLNCLKADKPTIHPCNKCDSCVAISRGEDIDVIEIDAASNTGVDHVRDIISNSQFRPARSRFKVYIIDEVHMLSKSAFNALLKTLEEPPEHVKFILATTEPEKVLPTILSRCQRFDFRNIPARQIAEHLKAICKKEKIKAEDDALLLVARAGAGSMRDSLSLLDRMLSVGETELTLEDVQRLLGLPRVQVIFDLAQTIGQGDVKEGLLKTDEILNSGMSADTLIASLSDHLRNLLILRTCGVESGLVEVPGLAIGDLKKQADQFDATVLAQDIAILEELRRQMRQSMASRALLDATLVRLAMAGQFMAIGELLSQVSGGSAAAGQKKKLDERSVAPAAPISVAAPAERIEQPVAEISANSGDLWERLLGQVDEATRGVLRMARLSEIADGQAVITFGPGGETFAKRMQSNGKREAVAALLSSLAGGSVGVRFECQVMEEQPAAVEAPAVQPRPAPVARAAPQAVAEEAVSPSPVRLTPEAMAEIENDPLVRRIIQELGARAVKVE